MAGRVEHAGAGVSHVGNDVNHVERVHEADCCLAVALQSEGIHDMVYHLLVVTQLEVVALFLFVGLLVGDKISFEGCHLALIEEWTVWTTPEIEEVIDGILFLVWVGILLE